MSTIASLGLVRLVKYFDYWGPLVLIVPVVVSHGLEMLYCEKFERVAGHYPTKAHTALKKIFV